jgi:NADPH:quinone reductase-like Zn-dependent oxidoreductase
VTGVCSTRNAGLVKSIGADGVIDYARDGFTRGPQRFDVIVANVANHPLSHCRRALTRKETLIPNADTRSRWIGGYSRTITALVMARFVPQRIRPFLADVNHDDLLTLAELIESGKITPVISRTFPLSEISEGIGYLERGHARGKIVITV